MEVIHWLAIKLTDIPLFEENQGRLQGRKFYNQFDSNPLDLITNAKQCSFNTSLHEDVSDDDRADETFVPDEALEKALLDSDRQTGILYNDTCFEHPSFDITSATADDSYLQKVFNIITVEMQQHPLSNRSKKVFEMRYRNNWTSPDTVYDAWLVTEGKSRPWFPLRRFLKKFPQIVQNDLEYSSSEEDEQPPPPARTRIEIKTESVTQIFTPRVSVPETIVLDDSDHEKPCCSKTLTRVASTFTDDGEDSGSNSESLLPSDVRVKDEHNFTLFVPKTTINEIIELDSDSDVELPQAKRVKRIIKEEEFYPQHTVADVIVLSD